MKKPKKKQNWHKGDICFWIEASVYSRFNVRWGRVDENFGNQLAVDILEIRKNRIIRDLIRKVETPIDEWENERYHKLPKGWTYHTAMYEIDHEPFEEQNLKFDLEDIETIKKLFERKILVKASSKFQGEVECEITKEGYRINKTYPMWHHKQTCLWVRPSEAYHSLEEANRVKADKEHELLRQCSLTDEEWSMEQIMKDIRKWANVEGLSMNHSKIIGLIDYFNALDKIDEVETRVGCSGVQWKREKQKKWRNVVL